MEGRRKEGRMPAVFLYKRNTVASLGMAQFAIQRPSTYSDGFLLQKKLRKEGEGLALRVDILPNFSTPLTLLPS